MKAVLAFLCFFCDLRSCDEDDPLIRSLDPSSDNDDLDEGEEEGRREEERREEERRRRGENVSDI